MFSTCSELTPRAPIPDGRMERIMQPCAGLEKEQRLGVNLLFLFSQGVFLSPATCFQSPYLDSKERAWIC